MSKSSERQLNLFSNHPGFIGNNFATKSRFKKYWEKFGVKKASLSFKKLREKSPSSLSNIRKQYNNIPLFYGLPTMERWLTWEKRNDKKT